MKLLHLADVHLDSPFSGLSEDVAHERRRETKNAFFAALDYIHKNGVDLLLIAGDLWEGTYMTLSTKKEVKAALGALPCPVVITPGNHDPYVKGSFYADDLPANVTVFSAPALSRVDFDDLGVSVFGYAFTSGRYEDDPLNTKIELSDKNINVLCAHTDIVTPLSVYAPMTAEEIARAGFSYAALGHIHAPAEPIKIFENCTVAYSGFLQGRGFDDLGNGGGWLVDLHRRAGGVERVLTRIPFSRMQYEAEKIDVTGCPDASDIVRRVRALCDTMHYTKNTALRLSFVGMTDVDFLPAVRAEDFSLSTLSLRDETTPEIDFDALTKDMTARGEFCRRLLPELRSPDEEKRKVAALALRYGLAALDGQEMPSMEDNA